MPLKFLIDENLRGPLWNAIQRHNAIGLDPIDAIRVGDIPDLPLGSSDPDILKWAEKENRILVSFDSQTMPGHLNDFLATASQSPGVLLIRPGAGFREIVQLLVMIAWISDPDEYRNRVSYLP